MSLRNKINNWINFEQVDEKNKQNKHQFTLLKIELEILDSKLKMQYQELGLSVFNRLKDKKVVSLNIDNLKKTFNKIEKIKAMKKIKVQNLKKIQ